MKKTKIKPSKFAYVFVRDYAPVSNESLITKWEQILNKRFDEKVFSRLFIKCRQVTQSTKLRYFQYRILIHALTTNVKVAKWDPNVSPMCTHCNIAEETYLHLFVDCQEVKKLWRALVKWWKHFNQIEILLSPEHILLSNFSGKYSKLVNISILVAKMYVYRCKVQKTKLNFIDLITDITNYKNLEVFIAKKNDNLYKFARKWDDFSIFSS